MVQQVLQRFDFTYSSPQATPLPTRHSLSALPSDESVEPSGSFPELVGCLIEEGVALLVQYVGHGASAWRGRPVVLTGHADASWADDQATQRSSQGYTFSLGSGSVSWRSTRSSPVLSSSCEAEIYARAMAAQELRWLTYLLTDLGEQPRSPPVLYVDNKAMLALCREHRLEHRTKHIALRYFLARELQQRGQLRLAYVASEANTADNFTKALPPGDHQRFCTMLGFPTCTQPILLVHHSCFFTGFACSMSGCSGVIWVSLRVRVRFLYVVAEETVCCNFIIHVDLLALELVSPVLQAELVLGPIQGEPETPTGSTGVARQRKEAAARRAAAVAAKKQAAAAKHAAVEARRAKQEAKAVAIAEKKKKQEEKAAAIAEKKRLQEAKAVAIAEKKRKQEEKAAAIAEKKKKQEEKDAAVAEKKRKQAEKAAAIEAKKKKQAEKAAAIEARK
ncbi:unnamed protein product [Closterium sp. NIES-54]